MASMKPEHTAFIREVVEITAMLEKLNDLIGEFVVAPPGREAVLRIEIEEMKERIKRFALRYQQ